MLVNQGDDGDFQGGRVCAKYVSDDDGVTWAYAGLEEPYTYEPCLLYTSRCV